MRLITLIILFLTICLSGCSGGGSGRSISDIESSPAAEPLPSSAYPAGPSPFPAKQFSLVFDEENAPLVLGFGLIMPKVALRLAQDLAQSLLAPFETDVDFTSESYSAFCQGADGFRLTHDDSDGNATYSAGDTVSFVLDNCVARENGELIGGEAFIELSNFNIANDGEVNITGLISLTDFELVLPSFQYTTAQVSGSYQFSYQVDTQREHVRAVANAENQLILADGIDMLIMRDFSASKSAPFDKSEYGIEFQHEMESTLLDGNYGCTTVVALTARQTGEYTGYELDCRGKDDQPLRVIPNDQQQLVVLGDETIGTYQLDQLIGNFLVREPAFSVRDFLADLYADQLLLGVASLADDSERNRVLVATTRDSALHPNSLLSIDVNSLQIEQSMQFDSPLTGLWLTPSGDYVYTAERNAGMALRIDLQAFAVTDRITLDPSEKINRLSSNGQVVPYLADLAFYPGSETDFIAVLARAPVDFPDFTPDNFMTAAYVDEVELPQTLGSISTPDQVLFQAPNAALGLTASTTRTITVAANGLVAGPITRNSGAQGTVIDTGDKLLVGSTAYSKTDYSVLSSFKATSAEVAYSQTTNRLYTLYDNYLSSFDSNRLTRLSYLRTPLAQRPLYAEDLLVAGNKLFIGRYGKLAVIDEAAIEDRFTEPCADAITRDTGVEGLVSYSTTCMFTSTAYDASRGLVYAGVDSDQGRYGNSIAIIDPKSAAITDYIELTATPRKLSVSATGALLYVVTAEQRILVIDAGTRQLLSNTAVPMLQQPRRSSEDFYAQHILAASASPMIDSDLAVSLSSNHGSAVTPDRNVLFRNGEFVLDNVVEGVQVPFAHFDPDGTLFGILDSFGSSLDTHVYSYLIDGSGLSVADAYPIDMEFRGSRKIENFLSVDGVSYAFFDNIRLNLNDGTWREIYSYPRHTDVLTVATDQANEALLWLEATTEYPRTCFLRRYDADGQLLGSFTLSHFYVSDTCSWNSDVFMAGDGVIGYLNGLEHPLGEDENVYRAQSSLEFYPASLLAD